MALDFERRRKRAGHLMSKLRFVSAQLIAYFSNGLWLHNARHANAMALRMAEGLQKIPSAKLLQPVQANELFVALPEESVSGLEMQGFDFYRWPLRADVPGVTVRLVTCFATSSADVDDFIAAAASIKPRG